MNINFEALKNGFKAYLEKLNETSGTSEKEENVKLSDVSIFMNSDKFKDYVSEELNIDSSDLPVNISDLLNMQIVNGKLVNPDELEDEQVENKVSSNDGVENSENLANNFMSDLLNDLFQDTDVIKSIDKDGDNTINQEEAATFLKFISKNDENADDVSLSDVLVGLEQIKNGTYNPFEQDIVDSVDIEDESISVNDNSHINENTSTNSYNSSGGSYYSSSSSNSKKESTETVSYESMSLEELSSAKDTQQTKIQQANDSLNAVYSGENEAVKSAQENLDEKKNEYDEAVKNDDKISENLKSERETNLNSISEKENEINDIKVSINDNKSEIFDTDNMLTTKNSELSAQKASLTKLQSQSSEDSEIQQQISSQIQVVKNNITSLETEIAELEQKKADLESEQQELEENLGTAEEELAALEEERTSIEEKISENCGEETKAALDSFNSAKANVEKVKNTQLKSAEKSLDSLQTDYEKINEAFNTKNEAKIKKDNHVSTSKLFDGESNLVAQKINENGTIPYILIGPENADPNEELPVLVYLHGLGQVGLNQDALLNVGPGRIIPEWDLEDFNGYILCPQLTGQYNVKYWNNSTAEGYIRNLLNNFQETHAVDKENIAIAGHSLGGMGTLYMAKNMDDVFSKAAVLSGYDVGIDTSDINIPIVGYVGTKESQYEMNNLFTNKLGEDSLITVEADHSGVPAKVFNRDTDGNGRSDLIEWLFDSKEYGKELPD